MSQLTVGKHWSELPEPYTRSNSSMRRTLFIHIHDLVLRKHLEKRFDMCGGVKVLTSVATTVHRHGNNLLALVPTFSQYFNMDEEPQSMLHFSAICVCVSLRKHVSYTWKGVLIRLTSVSKMWTPSCWWRRMKERRVCSRAGSVTLLRKRSRYAVVVSTSSSVSFIEEGGQRVGQTTEQLQTSRQRRIW